MKVEPPPATGSLALGDLVPPPPPAAARRRLGHDLGGAAPGLLVAGVLGDELLQFACDQAADRGATLDREDLGEPDRVLVELERQVAPRHPRLVPLSTGCDVEHRLPRPRCSAVPCARTGSASETGMRVRTGDDPTPAGAGAA